MTTNDNQPPLTAKDIMEKHGLCCDDESLDSIVVDDINKLVTQQTAAKDARIAELEVSLKAFNEAMNACVNNKYKIIADRDALQTKLDYLEKEIESITDQRDDMLDDWTKSEDTNASLRAQLDAANARLAMLQWQPIETAPKDGTPFLAFQHIIEDLNDVDNYWICDWHDNEWQGGCPAPTHWIPFPYLPEALKATEALVADNSEGLV